jgi:hypothetical protein
LSASHEEDQIFLVDFESNIPIKYNVKVSFCGAHAWNLREHRPPHKTWSEIFFIPFLKCVTKAKRSETPKTLLQLKNTIEQRGSPKLTLKIDNGTIVPKEILILLDCGKYCTKS